MAALFVLLFASCDGVFNPKAEIVGNFFFSGSLSLGGAPITVVPTGGT